MLTRAFIALALLLCLQQSVHATAKLQLQPVRLTLPADGRADKLTIINQGSESVVLQARIYAWAQESDGADRLEPTSELLLTPAIMRIEAGGAQTLRLAPRPDARASANAERAYRLSLDEVPPNGAATGLNLRMRYLLPVFSGGELARSGPLRLQLGPATAPCSIEVTNQGARHVVLKTLRVRTAGNTLEVTTPLYALMGSSFSLPCPPEATDPRRFELIELESETELIRLEGNAIPITTSGGAVAPARR